MSLFFMLVFPKTKHTNTMSHKIKIQRVLKSIPLKNVQNDVEVSEWRDQALTLKSGRKSSSTDSTIYSGLDASVKALLVAHLVEVPTEYQQKRSAISSFYDSLYIRIPADGLTLEIDLIDSKKKIGELLSKPIEGEITNDEINLPINIKDYIIYHAIFANDPVVAKNEKEAKENPLIEYWIIDEIAEIKIRETEQFMREEAQMLYFTFKDDMPKIKKVLVTLNSRPKDTSDVSLKQHISDLVNRNPKMFLDLMKDPNFEERYLLRRLQNFNIIGVGAGGSFFDKHSSETLAKTESAMIIWLKNPENSEKIGLYKTALQTKVS